MLDAIFRIMKNDVFDFNLCSYVEIVTGSCVFLLAGAGCIYVYLQWEISSQSDCDLSNKSATIILQNGNRVPGYHTLD